MLYVWLFDGVWIYYYVYMVGYVEGICEGMVVWIGDMFGYVGDIGDVGVGNYYLYFGVMWMVLGECWW